MADLKLVRVVLFLDWSSRGTWRDCLKKAAEREFADESNKKYPLTDEDTDGVTRRYTGKLPQYGLLGNSDVKLFEKYEIWRFLEVGTVAGVRVLCDSYVYFCENMERVDNFFQITAFEESEAEKVFDSGFNCRYNRNGRGVLRGIPLPFPGDLKDYAGVNEKRYVVEKKKRAVFHHATKCNTVKWLVIWNWGRDTVEPVFGYCDGIFSSLNFLKGRNMKRVVVIPDGQIAKNKAWDTGAILAERAERFERIVYHVKTVPNEANDQDELYVCIDCLPPDLVAELQKGDQVYLHTGESVNADALSSAYPNVTGYFFSVMERYPDAKIAAEHTTDFMRLLRQALQNPTAESIRAVQEKADTFKTRNPVIHFDQGKRL